MKAGIFYEIGAYGTTGKYLTDEDWVQSSDNYQPTSCPPTT